MVANVLSADPFPSPLGGWGQTSTFSENDHAAYQIKCHHEM